MLIHKETRTTSAAAANSAVAAAVKVENDVGVLKASSCFATETIVNGHCFSLAVGVLKDTYINVDRAG